MMIASRGDAEMGEAWCLLVFFTRALQIRTHEIVSSRERELEGLPGAG